VTQACQTRWQKVPMDIEAAATAVPNTDGLEEAALLEAIALSASAAASACGRPGAMESAKAVRRSGTARCAPVPPRMVIVYRPRCTTTAGDGTKTILRRGRATTHKAF